MDDRSFDNMVRELAAPAWSRRSLGLAIAGLALSLPTRRSESEAARRRQSGRRKTRRAGNGKRGASGRDKDGKKPTDSRPDDCEIPVLCTPDPATGSAGFVCPDGLCSCGGVCCSKGYACFEERTTPGREVCCFIDGDNSELPDGEKLVSCPGPRFDPNTCCDRDLCHEDGTCSGLTLGRYRRNPR